MPHPGHKCNSQAVNTMEAAPDEEDAWPEGYGEERY